MQNLLKQLEASKEFKAWKKQHDAAYLVHCFKLIDDANQNEWQIGYFSPRTKKISTFVLGSSITRNPDAEPLNQHGKIKQLDLKKVSISLEKALLVVQQLQKTSYANEPPLKIICLLQHIDLGQVWNMTYFTRSFKALNMKVDAASGEVKEHSLASLFTMEKGEAK
ncbi:hypothetical protein HZB02_01070 [Candidatus Woesearchaeota archaeon]|nr:hypothetical protein [Candidatus Woesearchaeota archaeon]